MTVQKQSGRDDVSRLDDTPDDAIQPLAPEAINPVYLIKRLFGELHWVREWVTSLCKSDLLFLLHLIDQPPYYVHFVCLVRLALLEKSDGGGDELEYAELFRTQSKKKILQRFYPSCATSLVKTLPKLRRKPLTQEEYFCLVELLLDKKTRKCVGHTKHVRRFALHAYTALPEEFQFFEIARCMRNEYDYKKIISSINFIKRFNITLTRSEINSAMKNMEDIDQLSDLLDKKLYRIPFPNPPWKGNDRIYPICSANELKKIGRQFNNCIAHNGSYHIDILFGKGYFYVCKEPQAVIQLIKNDAISWEIGEISGISNKTIPAQRKLEIMQVFWDAGFVLQANQSISHHIFRYNSSRIRQRLFQ